MVRVILYCDYFLSGKRKQASAFHEVKLNYTADISIFSPLDWKLHAPWDFTISDATFNTMHYAATKVLHFKTDQHGH